MTFDLPSLLREMLFPGIEELMYLLSQLILFIDMQLVS